MTKLTDDEADAIADQLFTEAYEKRKTQRMINRVQEAVDQAILESNEEIEQLNLELPTSRHDQFWEDKSEWPNGKPDFNGTTEKDQQLIAALRQQLADVNRKNQALKHEVTHTTRALADRNKQLNAMHWVWCSGGCPGGVKDRPSAEDVAIAIRNTSRLVSWWTNYHSKYDDNGEKKIRLTEWEDILQVWALQKKRINDELAKMDVRWSNVHIVSTTLTETAKRAIDFALERLPQIKDGEHPLSFIDGVIFRLNEIKNAPTREVVDDER